MQKIYRFELQFIVLNTEIYMRPSHGSAPICELYVVEMYVVNNMSVCHK